MKILFHENSLNLRGSSIAMFDYAYYARQLFGYEPFIVFNENDHTNDLKVKKKFVENFPVFSYKGDFNIVKDIVTHISPDLFYIIKSGDNDGKIVPGVKNCVHAVFPHSPDDKHGDVYACVSSWLSEYISNGEFPYVPHMINLPEVEGDYRKKLNIPEHATVFGRYGGYDSFDITFVMEAVKELLTYNKNVYFLFCNTFPFIEHPRAIFVNATASLEDKVKFINTCDALLHARLRGETFGLTVLEFMSKQKPIITFADSPERNHYILLNKQGYLYKDKYELIKLLVNFEKHTVNYTEVEKFSPKNIMYKFKSVFID